MAGDCPEYEAMEMVVDKNAYEDKKAGRALLGEQDVAGR